MQLDRIEFLSRVITWIFQLDLTVIKNFKVLHSLPLVYHLTSFGIETDSPIVYDYHDDVYGCMTKLRIAGGRRTIEMNQHSAAPLLPPLRRHSNYKENVFESRAFGVGAAAEEEEEILKKELKKKQVSRCFVKLIKIESLSQRSQHIAQVYYQHLPWSLYILLAISVYVLT